MKRKLIFNVANAPIPAHSTRFIRADRTPLRPERISAISCRFSELWISRASIQRVGATNVLGLRRFPGQFFLRPPFPTRRRYPYVPRIYSMDRTDFSKQVLFFHQKSSNKSRTWRLSPVFLLTCSPCLFDLFGLWAFLMARRGCVKISIL